MYRFYNLKFSFKKKKPALVTKARHGKTNPQHSILEARARRVRRIRPTQETVLGEVVACARALQVYALFLQNMY